MRLYLVILLMAAGFCSQAQNGYKVCYRSEINTLPVKENGTGLEHRPRYIYFVVNDSASFLYGSGEKKKDPIKKGEIYGHKVINHSWLLKRGVSIYYTGSAYPPGMGKFYVIDTVKKKNWTITDEIKEILGYPCRKAFWTNEYIVKKDSAEVWRTDSCIVWFTQKLPGSSLDPKQAGLTGLVLETWMDGLFGIIHTYAISIARENVVIELPKNVPVITLSELRARRR